MIRRCAVSFVLVALALCGCATAQRIGAAGDVHALLVAIRNDDQPGFDAHIDREALEQQLEARILQRTGNQGDSLKALGAAFAAPLAKLAGEALLQPQVFRAVAEYYGYSPDTPIPDQLVIAGALRALPDGKVCAAKGKGGPCLITFADESGVWRLVSFDGDVGLLKLH